MCANCWKDKSNLKAVYFSVTVGVFLLIRKAGHEQASSVMSFNLINTHFFRNLSHQANNTFRLHLFSQAEFNTTIIIHT